VGGYSPPPFLRILRRVSTDMKIEAQFVSSKFDHSSRDTEGLGGYSPPRFLHILRRVSTDIKIEAQFVLLQRYHDDYHHMQYFQNQKAVVLDNKVSLHDLTLGGRGVWNTCAILCHAGGCRAIRFCL